MRLVSCISFNGIPRTINCLGAFRAGLPADLTAQLYTEPTRRITEATQHALPSAGVPCGSQFTFHSKTSCMISLPRSHPDLPSAHPGEPLRAAAVKPRRKRRLWPLSVAV